MGELIPPIIDYSLAANKTPGGAKVSLPKLLFILEVMKASDTSTFYTAFTI